MSSTHTTGDLVFADHDARPNGTDPEDSIERRTYIVAFVAILLASAAFRIAYVLIVKRDDQLWTDEVYYTAQPIEIVEGRGYTNPFAPGQPSAGHAPITAAALTPVSWMKGSVVLEQRLLMAMYGTAVVAGIGLLARSLFDRRTALVAAAIAGVYGGFWLNDVMIMSETFAAAGVVGLLAAGYVYRRRGTVWAAVVFGVATGLAGLARAELLALGGVIGIFIILVTRRRGVEASDDAGDPGGGADEPAGGTIGRTRQVGHLAIAGAVAVLVIAPWVIRNMNRFEEPTFISTQDGGTLLGSNCPDVYDGTSVGLFSFACFADIEEVPGEDQSQVEARYREEGVEFISENADQLPRVVAFRLGRGLGFYRPNHQSYVNIWDGRARWASWLTNVQFWTLGVLAFVGLRRWSSSLPRWPVVSTLIFTVIVIAATYGNPRFRVPGDVGLVLAAAVAVDLGLRRLLSRRSADEQPHIDSADATGADGSA